MENYNLYFDLFVSFSLILFYYFVVWKDIIKPMFYNTEYDEEVRE